jgi:hypothetical protein
MNLTVFTIGQAPRPDLLAEIAAAAPGLAVDLHGALDGLSRAEWEAFRPQDGADTLFTVMPSGEGITVSKTMVTQRLRARLAATPGPVLLACTGAFKGLPERADLVQPSAVLNALAEALDVGKGVMHLLTGIDGLAVAADRDLGIKAGGDLDELGRGAGMQAALINNFDCAAQAHFSPAST